MARYIEAKCKMCRREGMKLLMKGLRCLGNKCSLERRNTPPGVHNWRRPKLSEYGKRFREKQKIKRFYGLFERQFRNYFDRACQESGNIEDTLLVLLERRLDNVLFRGGFALSRAHARQMIHHGHILVNGKKVDIPSYLVSEGNTIQPTKEASRKIIESVQQIYKSELPSWLEKSPDSLQLKMNHLPTRNEVQIAVQPQMVIEFFSR